LGGSGGLVVCAKNLRAPLAQVLSTDAGVDSRQSVAREAALIAIIRPLSNRFVQYVDVTISNRTRLLANNTADIATIENTKIVSPDITPRWQGRISM
jgi:hypothetical protein